jgi:hypothetical protein
LLAVPRDVPDLHGAMDALGDELHTRSMTRAAIKHTEERLRGAMMANDLLVLDELFADGARLVRPDGQVLSRDEELASYRGGARRLTRHDASEVDIELHGESAAVVCFRAHLEGEVDGASLAGDFRFSRVYLREHGAWRVVCSQATPIAPRPP